MNGAGIRWQALAVLAPLPWLAARLGLLPVGPSTVIGLEADGRSWPFLYVDVSALWLLPAAALWIARPPSVLAARLVVLALTLSHAAAYAGKSLTRYYAGFASAYDLSIYVQPLWSASAGGSMAVTWYGDEPLWAHHGSLGLVAFVPFARLFDDAGTGVLLAQAALAAGWLPAVFALARVLGLETGVALLLTSVAAATRAMLHAALYDFHPECALPLLFLLALAAYERKRLLPAALLAIAGCTLKEMAALTVAGAALYFALARRDRRCGAMALTGVAIAAFGMFALPALTGTYAYASTYMQQRADFSYALASTGMRALHTMLLGWLHPFSWFAGGPWAAAAGLSAKVAVKGVQYQYGFLHVPVAIAAVALALAALQRRGTRVRSIALVWALAAIGVNAPDAPSSEELMRARATFDAIRTLLLSPRVAPPGVTVATDACTAPYLMEREALVGLCLLDTPELARTGQERWTAPAARAFEAERIVVDRGCRSHGDCLDVQIGEARRRGYVTLAAGPRLLVLAKP